MAKLTPEGYINHLTIIRRKLDQFVQLVESGESHYFTDMAQQLRIMYLVRSRTTALITTISKQNSFKINVYVAWNTQEQVTRGLIPESLVEGLVMEINIHPAHWFDFSHELVGLLDAINRPYQVMIGNSYFSVADIIGVYADKMGGSHIDAKIKDADLLLHRQDFQVGGLSIADRVIYETARNSIILINMILEFLSTDQETKFIVRTI